MNRIILSGQFCGGEIEPGTFHGGEIEPGTFHRRGTPDLRTNPTDEQIQQGHGTSKSGDVGPAESEPLSDSEETEEAQA